MKSGRRDLHLRPLAPQSDDDSPQTLDFKAVANPAPDVSATVSPSVTANAYEAGPQEAADELPDATVERTSFSDAISATVSPSIPEIDHESRECERAESSVDTTSATSLLMLERLPLSGDQKAEALRQLLLDATRGLITSCFSVRGI
jgi:hypothetical protein